MNEKAPSRCPFSECDGSGLIPFWSKSGRLVPHAFVYCKCHEFNQPEHYHQVRPEDFDFPISYSYYRALCSYHGWADPGSYELPEPEPESQIGARAPIFRTRPVDKDIDQLRAEVNRINRLLYQKEREGKEVKSGGEQGREDITDRILRSGR